MSTEEIKDYLKRVDELGDKLMGENKETYDWLIYGYNQCAKLLNEKEQQCKKEKEYNQHLCNLNNTIFRELLNKRYENKKQKEVINKAVEYINQHWVIDNPVGFKNDLLEILEDKEVSE